MAAFPRVTQQSRGCWFQNKQATRLPSKNIVILNHEAVTGGVAPAERRRTKHVEKQMDLLFSNYLNFLEVLLTFYLLIN